MLVFTLFLLFVIRQSAANYEDDLKIACGPDAPLMLTSFRGNIYSPGYLNKEEYSDGIECSWLIYSREGYKIHLTFNDIDLDEVSQCGGDSLIVLNGNHGSNMNVFCGKQKPNDMLSKTNRLSILFSSDYIYSGRGFNLSYTFTSRESHCPLLSTECLNRKCISHKSYCDGTDDCGDDSDERYCTKKVKEYAATSLNQCGVPAIPPTLNEVDKVVGGQAAVEGSWPWQLDLQLDFIEPNGHTCGGALIAPQYALTAAHCLDSKRHPGNYRVIFGNYGRFKPTGHEQVRYIQRYVIYPYMSDITFAKNPLLRFSMDNDLALIKLSSPVKITERVQPICLPQAGSEVPVGTECYSTGWGKTQGTGGSDVLKQLKLTVDSGSACEAKKGYNETRLCAVSEGQESGLCSGDSGGPLVCQSNNIWYLRGITSHLSKGSIRGPICGMNGEGMTFAKISEKIEWINEIINILEKHKY